MTKIKALLILLIIFTCGCEEKSNQKIVKEEQTIEGISPITEQVFESSVIYEANIRQYSPEGTFEAFTRDIPQLKELGVKIIWLMPIYPISKTKRKVTGGTLIEDIEDPEEREKYLGSYYAVTDFKTINPEFGTIEDFRKLLQTAHDNGMYVILDWVPNHTGWDHVWIKEHPDFYTKNAQGEITDPLNPDGTPVGWEDVADLNYDSMELQEAMINDMLYWVTHEQIDGFRCDMAGMVPTSFWERAIPRLRAEKGLVMLAEADKPELTKGDLFDIAYGWEVHHIMNAIAKGEKNVHDFDSYMHSAVQKWAPDDILMQFVTNHDENSWAGSVEERMGPAAEAMTALVYCMPGMPLVYSGQEYDLSYRLKFFEKDTIPKEKKRMWPLLRRLGSLKNSLSALEGGKQAAGYERIPTSDDSKILAFRRKKGDSELIFIANLSQSPGSYYINAEGAFRDQLNDSLITIARNSEMNFDAWEYHILVKE